MTNERTRRRAFLSAADTSVRRKAACWAAIVIAGTFGFFAFQIDPSAAEGMAGLLRLPLTLVGSAAGVTALALHVRPLTYLLAALTIIFNLSILWITLDFDMLIFLAIGVCLSAAFMLRYAPIHR